VGEKKTKGDARIRKRREEGQMEFSKGLYIIFENYRGLSIKHIFSSIQNPNEEMPKTKVGEFFTLYNIALGPKFKNSKLTSLHIKF
jgi:hypothetical protein